MGLVIGACWVPRSGLDACALGPCGACEWITIKEQMEEYVQADGRASRGRGDA